MDMRPSVVKLLKRIVVCLMGLLTITLGCIRPTLKVQPIYVEDFVLTHNIGENGEPVDQAEVFKPNVGRIYAFARVEAMANEKMISKWYYEHQLIGAVENMVSEQGQVHWYLERPELFPEGQYRVEIYDRTVKLKDVTFEVR